MTQLKDAPTHFTPETHPQEAALLDMLDCCIVSSLDECDNYAEIAKLRTALVAYMQQANSTARVHSDYTTGVVRQGDKVLDYDFSLMQCASK